MSNNDIEKQLKKELRKERFGSNTIKTVMFFTLIALGLFLLYLAAPKPAKDTVEFLTGITLREIPASEGYGYDSAMIIRLENGNEARVPIEKDIIFKSNTEIEIEKITSEGGSVTYKFNRYKSQ